MIRFTNPSGLYINLVSLVIRPKMTAQETKTEEMKTSQGLKENEEIKCYVVLSVADVRKMLKKSRNFSKQIHDGKIISYSNDIFRFSISGKKSLINNGEYQGHLIED